jgi:hypothetical protein
LDTVALLLLLITVYLAVSLKLTRSNSSWLLLLLLLLLPCAAGIGHSLLSYSSTLRGISKLQLDADKLHQVGRPVGRGGGPPPQTAAAAAAAAAAAGAAESVSCHSITHKNAQE